MSPPLAAERGGPPDQLPQSLSASAPATSLTSDAGSRAASLGFRRRSSARNHPALIEPSDAAEGRPAHFPAGRTLLGGAQRAEEGGSSAPNLSMPQQRVCFPSLFTLITLLAFLGFWGGFVAVGVLAFQDGNPSRLTHPTDMFGFACGEINHWNGVTVDLRGKDLLYWLDPFELTNPRNRWFAKGICVDSCPAPSDACRPQDVPCRSGRQYRCPYYALAQDGLSGTLPYEDRWGAQYFDQLLGTSQAECWATRQGVPELFQAEALEFLREGSAGAQRCGEFYQLTSQFPGVGPCYAVWATSSVYLRRCVPAFPPEVDAALAAFRRAYPNDARTRDPLVQPVSGWDVGDYLLDVIHGWRITLFAGFVAPAALAVAVMLLMLKRPGVVVWLGLICCVAAMLADTLLASVKAGLVGTMPVGGQFQADVPRGANPSSRARKLWVAIASLLVFATLALLVLGLLLRRHLRLVVRLIRATSRVVRERPLVLLIPLLPLLLYGGLALFWLWSTIYLFTSSKIEPVHRSSLNGIATWWSPNSTLPLRAYELLNLTAPAVQPPPAAPAGRPLGSERFADPTLACAYDPDCYLALSFDRLLQHLFTYNYFGFWLANEFLTSVTGVCIVFCLSHHYFVLPNGARPRPTGFWRAVAHTWLALPPLVVGAVANTVVDWFIVLRPICSMLDKSLWRRRRALADPGSQWKAVLLAPLRGLGWAAHKLMKYSDRHGYYCGALHNTSYWQGCRIARALADAHRERLAGAFESAGSVFLMCKGAVAGLSILISLVWSMTPPYSDARAHPATYLSNGLLPVFFCILSAYFIAELWAQVYEASLAVLLLSFCEDCRRHGGTPRTSPPKLVEALQAAAAEQAERRHGVLHAATRQFLGAARGVEPLPHEEMIVDARRQGVEPGRWSGKSLGTQL